METAEEQRLERPLRELGALSLSLSIPSLYLVMSGM